MPVVVSSRLWPGNTWQHHNRERGDVSWACLDTNLDQTLWGVRGTGYVFGREGCGWSYALKSSGSRGWVLSMVEWWEWWSGNKRTWMRRGKRWVAGNWCDVLINWWLWYWIRTLQGKEQGLSLLRCYCSWKEHRWMGRSETVNEYSFIQWIKEKQLPGWVLNS